MAREYTRFGSMAGGVKPIVMRINLYFIAEPGLIISKSATFADISPGRK